MDSEKLYEGKAKILYSSENPDEIIQYFKDDATAFNAAKKDNILGKGILNNIISEYIMNILTKNNIPNHFIERIDERHQRVKKLSIIPLEVIIRNVAAGSICKRLGLQEASKFDEPICEFCYKDDALGDPLINNDHIVALKIASKEEIEKIVELTLQINQILLEEFKKINIQLVDFKIEFGRDKNGNILLADEISPDSCRLWDMDTKEKMDKDRFRLDLGSLVQYYSEIAKRFSLTIPSF